MVTHSTPAAGGGRSAIARICGLLALAIAVHGVVFAVASVTLARVEVPGLEAIGWMYLFLIIAPAMILATPFSPLLWHFHLMETPGWFAWPRASGLLLVYTVWFLAFAAVSLVARRR